MSDLRTDYKDDVLDTSQNVNRKFNIVDSNGNILYQDVSLEETTEFLQQGDSHSANVVNEQNRMINAKVSGFSDSTYSAVKGLAFDATNKKLGLEVEGADTVIPFSGAEYKEFGLAYWQIVNAGYGQAYGFTALFSSENGVIGMGTGGGNYTGEYIRIHSFYSAGVGWYCDLYAIKDCTVKIHKNSSSVTETKNMTSGQSYRLLSGSTSMYVGVEVV